MAGSLRELEIARNHLTSASFPESFQNMKQMFLLDLRNNSLRTLPLMFDKLESLTELTVSGNPLCDGNVTVCDPPCSSKIQDLLDMEGFGCKKQCSDFH